MKVAKLLAVAWSVTVTSVAVAGAPSDAPTPPTVSFDLPEEASVRPSNPDGTPHQVHARLIQSQTAIAPGAAGEIGVHLTQDAEWHTYWKSPGDIGLPTEIEWEAPSGIHIEAHEYSVPLRFEDEGIVSFGYDGQVLLTSPISIEPGVLPGEYPIRATVSWLVCQSSCIPGGAELATTLTVGPDGKASSVRPLFDFFNAGEPLMEEELENVQVTKSLSVEKLTPNTPFQVAIELKADGLEFKEGELWPTFTPIAGVNWFVLESRLTKTEDGLRVEMDAESLEPMEKPVDDFAGGLFQLKIDGKPLVTEIYVPIEWDLAPAVAAADDKEDEPAAPVVSGPSGAETVAAAGAAGGAAGLSIGMLLFNLGFAFVGGLILNVMPCVLPVLTLKLYGLVEQADIGPVKKRNAGLAYTGGILVSFWALAAAVVAAKVAFGLDVGWGFQFQYPGYVAALATVVFVFALNLFGVFEIPAPGVEGANNMSGKDGASGYFFTGVFATLVATPCSAPFMGSAIAFALQAPSIVLFMVFSMVGLGLAFPFLLIAFVPKAYEYLPKPGAWMESFKQFLGFTLVATAAWLISVLGAQTGVPGVSGFLWFLGFVSLGAWIFGRWGGPAASGRAQLLSLGVAVLVSVFGGMQFLHLDFAEEECAEEIAASEVDSLEFDEHIPWQPFSDKALGTLSEKNVFVDFTADWCVTCKVNEKTILELASVRQAMEDNCVVPLKADWTRRNPEISAWLERYDKAGVPFYLVFEGGNHAKPVFLPEVITPDMVIDAIGQTQGC